MNISNERSVIFCFFEGVSFLCASHILGRLYFSSFDLSANAEDSMLTVTLPYIDSARAGVERLGKIVAKQGAAETNGVIFSDK